MSVCARRSRQSHSSEIFGGVGFGSDAIGQAHAKFGFEAGEQLHALQAAKSEIAVEQRRRA